MVFHSFRHGFKDIARHVGIPESVQLTLMGHGPADVPDGYGDGQSMHQLVLGMLAFRTADLSLVSNRT